MKPKILNRLIAYPLLIVLTLMSCMFASGFEAYWSDFHTAMRYAHPEVTWHPELGMFEPTVEAAAEPQQGNLVPTVAVTNTTTGTTAISMAAAGTNSTGLFGRHSIYGYIAYSAGGCYLEIFDVAPGGTMTLGTTVPKAILPTISTSTGEIKTLDNGIPIFNLTAGLGVAAVTVPNGSTTCSANVTFLYD